mgnify:CR=1 FL=1
MPPMPLSNRSCSWLALALRPAVNQQLTSGIICEAAAFLEFFLLVRYPVVALACLLSCDSFAALVPLSLKGRRWETSRYPSVELFLYNRQYQYDLASGTAFGRVNCWVLRKCAFHVTAART